MEGEQQKHHRLRRLSRWLNRKFKGSEDPSDWNSDATDDDYDDDDDIEEDCFQDDFIIRSLDMGGCILTNDLRIFVGTWNVAGRSAVGSLAVDLGEWLNLKDPADIYVLAFQEIVPLRTRTVIGVEDPNPAVKWNTLIGKTLNSKRACPWTTPYRCSSADGTNHGEIFTAEIRSKNRMKTPMKDGKHDQWEDESGCSYMILASKKMVGVFISIWVKKDLLKRCYISNVKVCAVGCGIMGYLGNKGSVSVSMCIEGTNFCFIAAHLASGEKKGDEERRNYQVSEIFRRTVFTSHPGEDENHHPKTILGHEQIFWLGDLNYRLCLEDCLARQLIQKQDWKALQEFDQLKKEQKDGGVFQGWREGDIEFAPTYKYSFLNCNHYSGGLPGKAREKQRTPAWCDRILWNGKGVKQLSYVRSESRFSDHRPVSALFSSQIEVVRCTNTPITSPPNQVDVCPDKNDNGMAKSTLLSLLVQDMEHSESKGTTVLQSLGGLA